MSYGVGSHSVLCSTIDTCRSFKVLNYLNSNSRALLGWIRESSNHHLIIDIRSSPRLVVLLKSLFDGAMPGIPSLAIDRTTGDRSDFQEKARDRREIGISKRRRMDIYIHYKAWSSRKYDS